MLAAAAAASAVSSKTTSIAENNTKDQANNNNDDDDATADDDDDKQRFEYVVDRTYGVEVWEVQSCQVFIENPEYSDYIWYKCFIRCIQLLNL